MSVICIEVIQALYVVYVEVVVRGINVGYDELVCDDIDRSAASHEDIGVFVVFDATCDFCECV